jgi:hypothetical protein
MAVNDSTEWTTSDQEMGRARPSATLASVGNSATPDGSCRDVAMSGVRMSSYDIAILCAAGSSGSPGLQPHLMVRQHVHTFSGAIRAAVLLLVLKCIHEAICLLSKKDRTADVSPAGSSRQCRGGSGRHRLHSCTVSSRNRVLPRKRRAVPRLRLTDYLVAAFTLLRLRRGVAQALHSWSGPVGLNRVNLRLVWPNTTGASALGTARSIVVAIGGIPLDGQTGDPE